MLDMPDLLARDLREAREDEIAAEKAPKELADATAAWFEAMGRESRTSKAPLSLKPRRKVTFSTPNGLPAKAEELISQCVPWWAILECENAHQAGVLMGQCYAEDCPGCADGGAKSETAKRRAKGTVTSAEGYEGLRRDPTATALAWVNGGRTLLHTVFTLPKELRAVAGTLEWWAAVQRRLKNGLKRNFGLSWAMATSHPVGDQDGDTVFKGHLHVIWARSSTRRGVLDLPKLRETWRQALRWPEGRPLENPEHAFITRFATNSLWTEARVKHIISYAVRPFPGWSWWRGKAVRYWGHMPWVTEVVEPVVCPLCGTPYHIVERVLDKPKDVSPLIDLLREHGRWGAEARAP